MIPKFNVTIIGGGGVGCAIAHELSKTLDNILLIERNPQITRGENQSFRNSGVIHAGIYYDQRTSPLKARLCVEGNRLMYEFCENGVPYKKTGKLLLATEEYEIEYLDDVLRVAKENGVSDIRRISPEEAKDIEPNVHCISALYIPTSGIIDPYSLVSKLYHLARDQGVGFLTGTKVVGINPQKDSLVLTTEQSLRLQETLETRILINAAGLYSDVIGNMINPENNYEIEPTGGEAAKFTHTKRTKINIRGTNIYPAPYGYYVVNMGDNKIGDRARVPFAEFKELLKEGKVKKTVGIHITPTLDEFGEISKIATIGPAKSPRESREDYKHTRPLKYFYDEIKPFFSRESQEDSPEEAEQKLRVDDLEQHQVGVMAVNKNHPDWIIERDRRHPNAVQLIGIDSPGLTSCLSIARYVRELVNGGS